MVKHDTSQRRACRLIGVDPKTVWRERVPDNPDIRRRMREIASKRRRFGYRRIRFLLEREGTYMNYKKFRRLYREDRLAVKQRKGRKRAAGDRKPLQLPTAPSMPWSLYFPGTSTLTIGQRFLFSGFLDLLDRMANHTVGQTWHFDLRVLGAVGCCEWGLNTGPSPVPRFPTVPTNAGRNASELAG